MSMLTRSMARGLIVDHASALGDDEIDALTEIMLDNHTVVETEALRLDRETMRVQSDRIRILEDELKEARAEIKRLQEMSK